MPDEIPKFDDWIKTSARTRSGVTRHQPESDWSLAKLPEVESAFQTSTGRPLPVKVRGQGAIHNRWGYQHQDSADISLNPGSPEGQTLITQLRERNVPFLAFDRAIPGVATGPHIHIGRPSRRSQQTSVRTQDSHVPAFDDWVKEPISDPVVRKRPLSKDGAGQYHGRGGGGGIRPPRQQVSKADLERESYGRDLTVAEVKQAEDLAGRGQRSTIPEGIDLRVMKGEQPADRLAYQKEGDIQGRLAPAPSERFVPRATSMQARQPGMLERVKDVIAPHTPGLQSLDTPMGVKTDPLRGAASLGLADFSREASPGELVLDPQAQERADLAYGVGQFAPAVIPYVAAGKALSVVPSLNRATRGAHVARNALTFGGVEAARQGVAAVQGQPASPEEVGISTAIGAAIGGIAGVNPSLMRQVIAFVSPGVAVDIARGTPLPDAVFTALTNLGFGLHAGTAPRGLERKLGGRRAQTKTQSNVAAQLETVEPMAAGPGATEAVAQRMAGSESTVPEATRPARPLEVVEQSQSHKAKTIVRHQRGEIDGAEVVENKGATLIVEKDGKRHEIQNPRTAGNREAAIAKIPAVEAAPTKQSAEVTPVEGVASSTPSTPERTSRFGDLVDEIQPQKLGEAGKEPPTQPAELKRQNIEPAVAERLKELGASQNTLDTITPEQAAEVVHKNRTARWVVVNKATGEPVTELFGKSAVDKLNTAKYEAVPIGDYLANISEQVAGGATGTINYRKPSTSKVASSSTLTVDKSPVPETKVSESSTQGGKQDVSIETAAPQPKLTADTSVGAGRVTTGEPPAPSMKERATPKTLEKHGLEGGTDRLYEEQTNEGQLRAADATIQKHGIDAAVEIAKRSGDSGEQTALGISLVRQLQDAGKHEEAINVASDLARRLTSAGQAVQAVNVVSRLSPERQVLAAQRIVQTKNPNAKLRPNQAEAITKDATRLEDAIARIATLEARIEEIKLRPKVGVRKPRLETLNDRLVKAEQEARVRLAERAALLKVGGPERGASGIPADIADYAIIGASKLAQKGVTFASWSDAMIKDLGEDIRPNLKAIYRASYSTLSNERKAMRESTDQRLARKNLEGPVRPEDMGKLVEQRRQAQRDARGARSSLARTFNYLERGRGGQALDLAADVANVPRTVMSSFDLSAPLRQGGFFTLTEPKASGKATKDMISAISERGYDRVLEEIKDHADYSLAKRSGIEFTEVGRNDFSLSHTEEAYLSKTAGKLPVVKQSQQAYVAFLDSQRMQVFSKFANELKSQGRTMESHPEAFKYIAKFVNAGTGRGSLGRKGNQLAPYLNAVFFSPRFLASRAQLLNMMVNPVSWARTPEGAKGIIMRKNVQFLSTVGTALGLAAAAGATVGFDPDDADFLKVRAGDTRYDVLSGFQQPIRFGLRLGLAVGADLTKDETYSGEKKLELIGRFARSKEAPGFSFLHDYVSGDDYMGRKFDLTSKSLDNPIISRVLPMVGKDMAKAIKEEGWTGIAKTSPAFVGLGVQTYPNASEKPKTRAEKLARKFTKDSLPDEARTQEQIDLDTEKAQLRARSRAGEDVTKEVQALSGKLTERQQKSILDAKDRTRLQEDVNRLSLREALLVYGVANAAQRKELTEIIERKVSKVDDLPEGQQIDVRRRMKELNISEPVTRPSRPRRRSRREQAATY